MPSKSLLLHITIQDLLGRMAGKKPRKGAFKKKLLKAMEGKR